MTERDLAQELVEDPKRFIELLSWHMATVTRRLRRREQRDNAFAYVAGHLVSSAPKVSLRGLGRLLAVNEDQSANRFESLQHFMAHSTWDPLTVVEGNARLVLSELDAFRWRARQTHDRWFLVADTEHGSVSLGWSRLDNQDVAESLIELVERARRWTQTAPPLVIDLCYRSVAADRARLHSAGLTYLVAVHGRESAGAATVGNRHLVPEEVARIVDTQRAKKGVLKQGPFYAIRLSSMASSERPEWFLIYDGESTGPEADPRWTRQYWWSNLPAAFSQRQLASLLPDEREQFESDAAQLELFVYDGRSVRGIEHNWALGAAASGFLTLVRAGRPREPAAAIWLRAA